MCFLLCQQQLGIWTKHEKRNRKLQLEIASVIRFIGCWQESKLQVLGFFSHWKFFIINFSDFLIIAVTRKVKVCFCLYFLVHQVIPELWPFIVAIWAIRSEETDYEPGLGTREYCNIFSVVTVVWLINKLWLINSDEARLESPY